MTGPHAAPAPAVVSARSLLLARLVSGGPGPDRRGVATVDGRRLRQARLAHGLSRESLAARAGVSIRTVRSLECQPRACCTPQTLARLAGALGGDTAVISPVPDPRPGAGPGRGQRSRTLVFPGRLDQVRYVRALVSRVLGQGCPLLPDMALACSELAANAACHSASAGPGGELAVTVEVRDGDYAWAEVADQGGPWRDAAPARDEGGRGLDIVSALADYWDIRGGDEGRVVCVRIDWPGDDAA